MIMMANLLKKKVHTLYGKNKNASKFNLLAFFLLHQPFINTNSLSLERWN